MELDQKDLNYLKLLAKDYPTIRSVTTALVNLMARLNLPKGTEHFISDIHGEYDSFQHVLKNGSGSIERRIDEIFTILSEEEKRSLITLICYPEQRMSLTLPKVNDRAAWYRMTILRLIQLVQNISAKYTRADVSAFLPDDFGEIIQDLIYQRQDNTAQRDYHQSLLDTIIHTDAARDVIVALAELIQTLAVSHLHVIGDVYDRGPAAEKVMDTLMGYHKVDIQWGNHDILWMGAAAGSAACIANVIRISVRYANTDTLETGYGISLLPLASFAIDTYGDDPCEQFRPKLEPDAEFTDREIQLFAQMQKAIAIIQLKVESQIIQRHPHYKMQDRLLLEKIDHENGTITLDGKTHKLLDTHFPTIDPADPYALTEQEKIVVDRLKMSFANSRRLQQHVSFLYANGGMYQVYNGNLLYHGCIAMNADGTFQSFDVDGGAFSGKAFMDRLDRLARQGYFSTDDPERKQYGMDSMWYLWSGPQSPLFGKAKMATFERYFIADKATHKEERNPYYDLRDDPETASKILREFGVDPDIGHIVNGHVPVKVKQGESPVKADGKLLVIDGGFAKAYQEVTGIAGYTLIFNSYGLLLAEHQPFESAQSAIENERGVLSSTQILETNNKRLRVRNTDLGDEIQQNIVNLKRLLDAYRDGLIKAT